jgi:hypothetical protein
VPVKKPAITGLARPAGIADDLGKAAAKAAGKRVRKVVRRRRPMTARERATGFGDVPDKKFRGRVYNNKGGMKDSYKDYVMRNMKGDF